MNFRKCAKCSRENERLHRCINCKKLFCYTHIYASFTGDLKNMIAVSFLCKPCEEVELNLARCCSPKKHKEGVRKCRLENILKHPDLIYSFDMNI